ncbi:tetratricopeptide repeat-containing sensor histidine kinase [Bernardetia sp.]|uniref:tetratricopeptide repeat-containing sensor histidine kinase n=1 Tax=Bernardetia sp. TaxID=1937974 RepID=UPI0025BA4DDE|nr:tetratricopeptide repeat-containing sensor histidine kinase [Bernardetia sp.]
MRNLFPLSSFSLFAVTLFIFFSADVSFAQNEYTKDGKKVTVQQYLEKSNERAKEGDYRGASDFLNKAALIKWEDKDLRPAINYFQASLNYNKKVNNQSGMYGIYSNLAMIYADLAMYDSSLYFFKRTLKGRRKNSEKVTIISSLINVSVVLNNLKRYDESAEFLEEALKLAQEMNDIEQMRSCYGMLAETYEKAGNSEKKLHYFNLYKTFHELTQKTKIAKVNEELYNEKLKAEVLALEKRKADLELSNKKLELKQKNKIVESQKDSLGELTSKYTKQELALQLLKEKANAERAEAQNKIQRQEAITRTAILVVFFVMVVAALLFYFYIRTREKNKRLAEQRNQLQEQAVMLEEQQEELETQKSLVEQQRDELGASNKVKDRLFSIISHDLRTPFTSVNGYLTLIKYGALSPEEVVSVAGEVKLSVDHHLETLNNVLEWSRNQMKGLKPEPTNINLNKIAQDQKKFFKALAESKDIQVINEVDKKIEVFADPNQIDVILRNLVGNALKFTPNEGKITVSSQLKSDSVIVSVTDTGVGMSEENLKKLFKKDEHFTTQGTNNEAGTGLGLILCRDFVEANGGTIRVESEEGKGTSFIFDLPLAEQTQQVEEVK